MGTELPLKTHYIDLHVDQCTTQSMANKKRQCDKQMMRWDIKLDIQNLIPLPPPAKKLIL